MGTRARRAVVGTIFISACTVASEAAAQPDTEEAPPPAKGWRYEIAPYAWLPVNVSGDATVRNRDIPVDASLGDLTKNLELAAAARFEAWNGRFGLIADGMFLKVGDSGQLPGPLGASFDWTSRVLMGDLMLGMRPVVAHLGGETALSLELDVGARVAWLDSDVEIAGESVSGSRAFARGLLGARVPLRLSRLWGLGVRGALSVPGVGWASLGWVEIDPLKWLGIMVAYRVERLELTGDRVALSATAHGPYVSIGFRFGSGSIY